MKALVFAVSLAFAADKASEKPIISDADKITILTAQRNVERIKEQVKVNQDQIAASGAKLIEIETAKITAVQERKKIEGCEIIETAAGIECKAVEVKK